MDHPGKATATEQTAKALPKIGWMRCNRAGEPTDITLDAELAKNWQLQGHPVNEFALPCPATSGAPVPVEGLQAELALLQRRYLSLIGQLAAQTTNYDSRSDYTAVDFTLFFHGDQRWALKRACAGHAQCDKSGKCGAPGCPSRYLTDELVDKMPYRGDVRSGTPNC
ncbi:hypothetical protein F6X40_17595 [Paraburkholderia sp. UCT31]|uniref:hypothetical protein n=1 Tax=Paraburkholderia sp. UCT31 TaxID=2615209 RepID=UPI0016565685|nr:hypothetical protein [Paraburkholderia sp. UCT31]MBC8738575.1 hypothetical protein [Paraburkholderia sp. UCT31]